MRAGGVATSGLDVRLWRAPDGTPRHHLLDPATGAPAWTGVIAATALGETAVDAEIDAKAALLAGATGAVRLLREVGGAVVLEGEERVRLVGLAPAPIRVRVPTGRPHDRRGAGSVRLRLVDRGPRGGDHRDRARERVDRARPGDGDARAATTGHGGALRRTHQYVALSALVAIAAHGVFLLLDPWLHPSASALVVPFQLGYRPVWTGLGVIAGSMIVVLGVSYWLRDRIGRNRWAAIHRLTFGAYVLALAHVVGSGTDATSRWLLVVLAGALVPVVPLLARRLAGRRPAPPPPDRTAAAPTV
jgi:sulfoxide reductase heme-binding subunit YedZ